MAQSRGGGATALCEDVAIHGSISLTGLREAPPIEAALLTGGQDRHYAAGLATSLAAQNVLLDVIGNGWVDGPEMHETPGLRFLKLYSDPENRARLRKIKALIGSYLRLMRYAAVTKAEVLHVLWNYRLELVDRTLLMAYFKLLGKKVTFTAHNVNAARRDGRDSFLNHLSLKVQYRLSDRIFVHTEKMKRELVEHFGVSSNAVTIIPYGVNNAVPISDLTREEARRRIGLRSGEKGILFFGAIKRYKGLQYLVEAFEMLAGKHSDFRLIIAGERKKGSDEYLDRILSRIAGSEFRESVIQKIEFIPDEEIEVYFKAADVAVLPYTEIFQSGILFLTYNFGLPVIASDVGSFREDVIEGRTGFVCRAEDAADLAAKIEMYFESDLFRRLEEHRKSIRDFVYCEHSWDKVSEITRGAYAELIGAKEVKGSA